MRRLVLVLAVLAALGGVVAFLYGPLRAAEPKLAGTWKVVAFLPTGAEMTVWLLRLDESGGELSATVVAAGQDSMKEARVAEVSADNDALRLKIIVAMHDTKIEMPLKVYFPQDKGKPQVLRGELPFNGESNFAQLERTEFRTLDPRDAMEPGAYDALARAGRTRNPAQRKKIYTGVIADHPDKPAAVFAAFGLLAIQAREGAAAEEIRKTADGALQVAAPFGPEMKRMVLTQTARQLSAGSKSAALAVEYARQAEKMLSDADPPVVTAGVLKTLAAALTKSGDTDGAAKLAPRIEKLEVALDAAFRKDAVPFPLRKFTGRKKGSDRVAVVELFTGAHCGPCVAADVAFDGLIETYSTKEAVLLEYHQHAPMPDPLTNADGDKRAAFYDVAGTPSLLLDGQAMPQIGGPKPAGQAIYNRMRKMIDDELGVDSKITLTVTATRKGDKINMAAEVAGLDKPAATLRLRFVLIEDEVRYAGTNGQRLHHHVVRAFPGGVDGMKLVEASGKFNASVDVTVLTKSLNDYLTTVNARMRFLDEERPLKLKQLKVVAFIQDEESKNILQAAQVDVAEEK